MPKGDVDHRGYSHSRVGQPDVVAQLEQAGDRPALLGGRELLKWPRQVATGADDGRTASAVVPVGRGVESDPRSVAGRPNEQFLDEEPVVQNDNALRRQ